MYAPGRELPNLTLMARVSMSRSLGRRGAHHRRDVREQIREMLSGRSLHTTRLVQPVLVGYDSSAASRRALVYAAGLALRLDRPLLVLHVRYGCANDEVVSAYPAPGSAQTAPLLWLYDDLAAVPEINDVSIFVAQVRGRPGPSLRRAAAWSRAEALVLGAPRQRWHRMFGSQPSWLVRRALCPVITVP